jgi:hypothetical protein
MKVGLVGILTIVFVTLKLTNTIDWSWWWVLAPIWIFGVILGLIMLVLYIIDRT